MAMRINYENSNDIGVFAKLTNSYCLVADTTGCKFLNALESELGMNNTPVIPTTIAGNRVIGRLVAGNKNGLLVPHMTSDLELQALKESLPETVLVKRIDERLSALGNCIACNDYVAIAHPDLEKDTEEIIQDTLGVEVFRTTINKNNLVGSYCLVNNNGGLIHPMSETSELEELSNLFQIPVAAGTLNKGSELLGSCALVNDSSGFIGLESTISEVRIFDGVFKLGSSIVYKLHK